MGRRSRRRAETAPPQAPVVEYPSADGEQLLSLRCVLTPRTRAAYADVLAGSPLSQEDAWQRAVEFLFERLAVRWTISDVPTEGQRELLARYRVASQDERRFVRDTLRSHLAEHFPDVEAP